MSCAEDWGLRITSPDTCPYSLNLPAHQSKHPPSPPPRAPFSPALPLQLFGGGELAAITHIPLLSQPCRWLVGVSYRVIYHKDSIPAGMSVRSAFLKHVHGAVYSAMGRCRQGRGQPLPSSTPPLLTTLLSGTRRLSTLCACGTLSAIELSEVSTGPTGAGPHRVDGGGQQRLAGLCVSPSKGISKCSGALGGELWVQRGQASRQWGLVE